MIRHHPIQFASRRQSLVHLVAHGRIVLVALVAKDVAQPVGGVVQIVGAVLGIRLQARATRSTTPPTSLERHHRTPLER
jgi:hypothetical protein